MRSNAAALRAGRGARAVCAAVLLVLLVACTAPSGSEAPAGATPTSGRAPTTATEPSDVADTIGSVTDTATDPAGMDRSTAIPRGLVGAWSVPVDDLVRLSALGADAVFTRPRSSDELDGYVAEAHRLGLYVFFSPVDARSAMAPGCTDRCPFDLDAYRAAVAAFAEATSARGDAAFLPDEPFDPSNWGGTPMTWEDVEGAARVVRELLDVPAIVNVGELRGAVPTGVVDGVSVTFYRNKLQRHGSLDAYLEAQTAALDGSAALVVLLQGSAGEGLGSLAPEELAAQTIEACRHPDISGVLWWTWVDKRDARGLGARLADPDEGPLLAAALAEAASSCRR